MLNSRIPTSLGRKWSIRQITCMYEVLCQQIRVSPPTKSCMAASQPFHTYTIFGCIAYRMLQAAQKHMKNCIPYGNSYIWTMYDSTSIWRLWNTKRQCVIQVWNIHDELAKIAKTSRQANADSPRQTYITSYRRASTDCRTSREYNIGSIRDCKAGYQSKQADRCQCNQALRCRWEQAG